MTAIDFITLSRSDYTTLRPVALAAEQTPEIEVNLIAGGSHMLQRFGNSIEDIRKDGFKNISIIDFLNENDNSDADMASAYARAVTAFTEHFENTNPQMVFIVGDRWEMLAVATAASMCRIPIAHHSGGDITQGSADNQTRYVLSTLGHLHFVALDEHKTRLCKMGEEDWRITVSGEPALTGVQASADSVQNLFTRLGLNNNDTFVLATFHPTSYDPAPAEKQIEVFIKTLKTINDKIVLTAPNPDAGSAVFLEKLTDFANENQNVHLHSNLGAETYYAAMANATYMIGNSSSGLWEAPSFRLPVINIGPRQNGRVRSTNVIDAPLDLPGIQQAIAKLSDVDFQENLKNCHNPYVRPDTIESIINVLKQPKDKATLLAKKFIDPLQAG